MVDATSSMALSFIVIGESNALYYSACIYYGFIYNEFTLNRQNRRLLREHLVVNSVRYILSCHLIIIWHHRIGQWQRHELFKTGFTIAISFVEFKG